jgi:hypothetical protein
MYSYKMDSITPVNNKPANMGKPWLDDETLQLLKNVRSRKAISDIADDHKRTEGGILSRLRSMAVDYHNEGRSIEVIEKFTGLSRDNIMEAIERRNISERIRERKIKEKEGTKVLSSKKVYTQASISTFAEKEPTMKDIMNTLKDIQSKLATIISKQS